jgi:chromosome segregation ATPase
VRFNRLDPSLQPYNHATMTDLSQINQISERVERLLVRQDELTRTNALLYKQIDVISQERDSLKSRLSAARARVEALLKRLPETPVNPEKSQGRS